MPVFRYHAIDKQGRNLGGLMTAVDEANLDQKLKNLGLWLTESEAERQSFAIEDIPWFERLRLRLQTRRQRRELIDFCTLMSYQIRVGVPLVRALESATRDCKDPRFRKVLSGLQKHIEGGHHFYEALAHYPNLFTPHFTSIIRAGEMSSHLPEAFEDLRKYLEWVDQIVAEVRQATLYPAIVLTVITAFVLMLFTFVVPRFVELLDKLNVKQPLITQVVFSMATIARATWWLWLPLFVLALLIVPVGRRLSGRFAYAVDGLKLRLPVFGELNQMLALSRFTHNLAILYRSGLPILQALELCKHGLIGNAVIERAVAEISQEVKGGSTIGEAMHRQTVFPAMVLRMVGMGETTGNLDHALDHIAEFYNDVIPRRIKKVFTVLEPALMLLLIGIVGCVALAIYLPILSLMGGIRQ
jgi:type II secretory pathway component PulF